MPKRFWGAHRGATSAREGTKADNEQITILKVVMERVPAVASLGSKGTPGQAGRCPGTSGQAVALSIHQDYERQHPAKP